MTVAADDPAVDGASGITLIRFQLFVHQTCKIHEESTVATKSAHQFDIN
ncbi:hypothetical protein GW891_05385 [bacterium]|nr:hypothetical protein [bacterium]